MNNITVLQKLPSQTPLMQSPRAQLQSHQQQPKSTCSQLKSAFVAFQQTPKRQGQQTMRRLLPACSAFTKPRAHSPTANNLTFISQEGITAMPSMKSPPDTVGQVGWLLSPHDIQMHVGFQQTPQRQGQQTMGRLLLACSAFTNPPNSSELR